MNFPDKAIDICSPNSVMDSSAYVFDKTADWVRVCVAVNHIGIYSDKLIKLLELVKLINSDLIVIMNIDRHYGKL